MLKQNQDSKAKIVPVGFLVSLLFLVDIFYNSNNFEHNNLAMLIEEGDLW